MTREWNATSYHKVSGPQTCWGQKVLKRLDLKGDERAIDAGCGSGRLTGGLDGTAPARAARRDRPIVEHVADRAREPPAGVRLACSFVQVSLPALPFDGMGGPGVQHRHLPLGERSSGALREHLQGTAAGRPPARAVRRRPNLAGPTRWPKRSWQRSRSLHSSAAGRAPGSSRRRRQTPLDW